MSGRESLRKVWGTIAVGGLLAWIAYDLLDGAIKFGPPGVKVTLTGFPLVVFVGGLIAAFFAHLFESSNDARPDWDKWTFWAGLGGAFAAYIAALVAGLT